MARRGDPVTPPAPSVARVDAPRPAPGGEGQPPRPPRPRRPSRPPAFRPGRPDEALACAAIWELSIADYERRLGRPVFPADLGPVTRLIEHLAGTDPERFWVAERTGRPVGFAMASVRGATWFLGLLFVLPEEQANGVGRELLSRTLPAGGDASGRPPSLGTTTDSVQPVSNALYARLGIVPRVPYFRYVGRPTGPGRFGSLPAGATFGRVAEPDAATDADLAALDATILGTPRPDEHRFYRADGRRLYVARGGDGDLLGYGYVSAAGALAPVAARTPELLTPLVGALLDAHVPAGPSSVKVGGETPELVRALLDAGLRVDGFPALVCWDRPFARLDRYLLGSYALP